MSTRATDHHVGINTECKFCGARWGGLIPRKHRVGCTRNMPQVASPTPHDGTEVQP